ncbi:hypothetical protein BGZ60DRAFT_421638, partial [Tricladium varicosporioides]
MSFTTLKTPVTPPQPTYYDSDRLQLPTHDPQSSQIDWDRLIDFGSSPLAPPLHSSPPPHTSVSHTPIRVPEPEDEADEAPASDTSSTASWDSRNGPRPDNLTPLFRPQSTRIYNAQTTRDDRIRIQTALLFNIPHDEIRFKLDVTEKQIYWASRHRPTPQNTLCHQGKVKLRTPQKQRLEQWLQA